MRILKGKGLKGQPCQQPIHQRHYHHKEQRAGGHNIGGEAHVAPGLVRQNRQDSQRGYGRLHNQSLGLRRRQRQPTFAKINQDEHQQRREDKFTQQRGDGIAVEADACQPRIAQGDSDIEKRKRRYRRADIAERGMGE